MDQANLNKPKIAILTFPMASKSVNVLVFDFLDILIPICENIILITSNIPINKQFDKKVHIRDLKVSLHFRDKYNRIWAFTYQIIKILIIQFKMSLELFKARKEIEIVVSYVGGANLCFPIILSYFLRKKIVVFAVGLGSKSYERTYKDSFFLGKLVAKILNQFEKINFRLADKIVVESDQVVDFLNLEMYRGKISVTGAKSIQIDNFRIEKSYEERKFLVGYIGRLEEGKGVINLLESFSLILKYYPNAKFILGGEGPLFNQIQIEIKKKGLIDQVKLIEWIPYGKVQEYLNQIKIFVLPTYSEGLPTIILESMACGTIVLATGVGGIPDILKDSITGFIMDDNSPDDICYNILRILNSNNLSSIVINARKLIESDYSFDGALERYQDIFTIFDKNKENK